MKMMYNGMPINSAKVNHFEMNTNDATMTASDMQAGVTGYAKGVKVEGTGKAFEFASYGSFPVNRSIPIPTSDINTIVVSSTDGAVKMKNGINSLRDLDFAIEQEIAKIIIENIEYSLTVKITNNKITFGCIQNISVQAMIGKDNFI